MCTLDFWKGPWVGKGLGGSWRNSESDPYSLSPKSPKYGEKYGEPPLHSHTQQEKMKFLLKLKSPTKVKVKF